MKEPEKMRPGRMSGKALLLAAALILAGCGYSLMGRGGSFPAGVEKMYVATFKNGTNRYGLEGDASTAFIQELMATGKVKITGPGEADAIFEGVLTGYDTTPIAISAQREVRERRLVITARVEFRLKNETKPFYAEDGLRGKAEYEVSEDLVKTGQAEKEAAQKALREMAKEVIARVVEGF